MNKIHWNHLANRLGQETTLKLKVLAQYYADTKVSDYYRKGSTLLEVGKLINKNRSAEIIVCPHFGKETIRGVNSQDVKLDIHTEIPKRLLGFIESGLVEILHEIELNFSVKISTKEFIETGYEISFFEEYLQKINQIENLIKTELKLNSHFMTKQEVAQYQESFLPNNFKEINWPEDFWVPQSQHAITLSEKDELISIQSEVLHFPLGQSFYKEAFGKTSLPIIGYRTKKQNKESHN